MDNRRALFSQFDSATDAAATALAACRAFDHDQRSHGSWPCSETAPCRLCHYDAAAAVAAVLLFLEERRLIDANGEWT